MKDAKYILENLHPILIDYVVNLTMFWNASLQIKHTLHNQNFIANEPNHQWANFHQGLIALSALEQLRIDLLNLLMDLHYNVNEFIQDTIVVGFRLTLLVFKAERIKIDENVTNNVDIVNEKL